MGHGGGGHGGGGHGRGGWRGGIGGGWGWPWYDSGDLDEPYYPFPLRRRFYGPLVSGEGSSMPRNPAGPDRFQAALTELSRKPIAQVQQETALTWAYRARAAKCYALLARQQGREALAQHWMHDATEYSHEAIEHAALCGSGGDDRVLHAVRRICWGG